MAVLSHNLRHLRKLVLGGSLHSDFLRPHLNLEQNAHVINHSRDNGGNKKLIIFHSKGIRHDEGSGTHNRRHELSADRTCRHNGACKFIVIPGFFHKRDGERACGHYHGDSCAVNHAQKAGGDNGYLCGTALGAARDGIGKIIEELAHAAFIHNLTKRNKQEDICGGHVDRRPVYPFRVGEEMAH